MAQRKCTNCKYLKYPCDELCIIYEMFNDDEVQTASNCGKYECKDSDDNISSVAAGDYGPGNPWDAPGMSIRDFI